MADTAKELGIDINLNYSFAQLPPAAEADSPSVVETDNATEADSIVETDKAAGVTFGVADTQPEFAGARHVRAIGRARDK